MRDANRDGVNKPTEMEAASLSGWPPPSATPSNSKAAQGGKTMSNSKAKIDTVQVEVQTTQEKNV